MAPLTSPQLLRDGSRRAAIRLGAARLLACAALPAMTNAAKSTEPTEPNLGTRPSWRAYAPQDTRWLKPVPAQRESSDQPSPQSGPPRIRRAAGQRPPAAFEAAAARHGIPAWLMYGVALQESVLTIGRAVLPYPWTLNVAGRPERHRDADGARAALRRYLRTGVTNVDCGPMQLNWRWHQDRLGTVERALDPYVNLDVGANLLADLRRSHGDWRIAVQLYHAGSLNTTERRARAQRYLASVERRLQRHGISFAAAIADVAGVQHG